MATVILIAAALMSQSPAAGTTVIAVPSGADHVDVGYEELVSGRPAAAIERIRANRKLEADDPAALINLGTAYARLGQRDKAAECYRAAIASDERYDLELADGSWMDSRRAARAAFAGLQKGGALALR